MLRTPHGELRPGPRRTPPTGASANDTAVQRSGATPRPQPPEVSDDPSGLESSQEKTRMPVVPRAKFRHQRTRAGTAPQVPKVPEKAVSP